MLTEPASGLKVLAQGLNETVAISPADILASTAFADVIDTLRSRFDLVVLDTPPALAVTDSRLLARLSDAVVYLVRWNHTSKNAVREGLRELDLQRVHRRHVVHDDADRAAVSRNARRPLRRRERLRQSGQRASTVFETIGKRLDRIRDEVIALRTEAAG